MAPMSKLGVVSGTTELEVGRQRALGDSLTSQCIQNSKLHGCTCSLVNMPRQTDTHTKKLTITNGIHHSWCLIVCMSVCFKKNEDSCSFQGPTFKTLFFYILCCVALDNSLLLSGFQLLICQRQEWVIGLNIQ